MSAEGKSIVPDSVDNAIKNATDSPSLEIGKTLGDIFYLVFGSVHLAADKRKIKYAIELKKYEQELNRAINNIPEEKACEPKLQTVGVALEKSKFVIEEEAIREMFVRLISKSMNSDYTDLVHPSFPEVVSQMTPFDARVLAALGRASNSEPIVELRIGENSGYNTYKANVMLLDGELTNLVLVDKCSASIDYLARVGLVRASYIEFAADNSAYEAFYKSVAFEEFKHMVDLINKDNPSLCLHPSIGRGSAKITTLGRRFLDICLK